MPIFLTSTGFYSDSLKEKFINISQHLLDKQVSIVTTAAEDKDKSKYAQLALTQFQKMGFNTIEFVDLEFESDYDFSSTGIIYVMGGNTFTLMYYASKSNFKQSVQNVLKNGGVYVGVSAGSIIIGSTILTASEILQDENSVLLKRYEGLNIFPFGILPHYNISLEEKVKQFEMSHNTEVKRISDEEYILLN